MDEKPPLTKEERRARQKRLEQARKRKKYLDASEPLVGEPDNSAPAAQESPPKRPGRQKRRRDRRTGTFCSEDSAK